MGSLFGGSASNTQQQFSSQAGTKDYSPEYGNYVNKILAKASDLADKPFEPYDVGKMFAGFTPDQQQAFEQIRATQGAWQPSMESARGSLDRAGAAYDPRAGQDYLARAGAGPTAYDAGAGAIRASTQGWNNPNIQASYMNPYVEGAINRAQDLTARNFSEKLMPQLNSQFAKGMGQLGRSNYQTAVGRLGRDVGGEMSGNALTMMNQGYQNAAQNFQSDQERLQRAGVNLGGLAQNTMGALSNLAQTGSNITTGAVNTGVGLANAYTGMAGALSRYGYGDADALMRSGQLQQAQAQLPLTAQYQQFQQGQQFPWQQVMAMNQAQSGLRLPERTQQSGQSYTTAQKSSDPGIASTLLGAGLGALSIPGVGSGLGSMFGSLFGGGVSPVAASMTGAGTSASAGVPGLSYNPATGGYSSAFARGGVVRRPRVRHDAWYPGGGALNDAELLYHPTMTEDFAEGGLVHDILGGLGSLLGNLIPIPVLGPMIGRFAGHAAGNLIEGAGEYGDDAVRDFSAGMIDPDQMGFSRGGRSRRRRDFAVGGVVPIERRGRADNERYRLTKMGNVMVGGGGGIEIVPGPRRRLNDTVELPRPEPGTIGPRDAWRSNDSW